jgi:diguanylate cyclase
MTSDQSWKEKYLQELESAEQRQKQWEAEKTSLQRMLVRTCLASEGQAAELDLLLNELRKDLRKDSLDLVKWRTLQDQIDRQIALLDEPAVASSAALSTPVSTPVSSPISAAPPQPAAAAGDDNDLGNNQQRLRIARRVGQLLGQLLQQVTLEPGADAEARQLQQSLLKSRTGKSCGKG